MDKQIEGILDKIMMDKQIGEILDKIIFAIDELQDREDKLLKLIEEIVEDNETFRKQIFVLANELLKLKQGVK